MLERLSESALLLVIGMSTVFLSLLFLAGMIWVIKQTDELLNARRIRKYSENVERKTVDPELNDETIAVIAAAATEAAHRPVVIRRVSFLKAQAGGSWSSSGRINIMASHSIAKKTRQS